MFKAVSNVLVIAVMLVTFVGQAMAFNTAIPCEKSENSLSHSFSEQVTHNYLKQIDTDKSEDCCGIECCSVGCTCIANACSSFVYVNTDVNPTNMAALSEAAYIQLLEQPNSPPTLLYRPPI
jgi:hypothetical protein